MYKFLEKAFLTSSLDINHANALNMIDWGKQLASRDRFMYSFLSGSKESEGSLVFGGVQGPGQEGFVGILSCNN